jgi:hypothetical protein
MTRAARTARGSSDLIMVGCEFDDVAFFSAVCVMCVVVFCYGALMIGDVVCVSGGG